MSSQTRDLGHLIKKAQHRHHRAADIALSEIGISLVQWNALREIARHPDSTMHRLAELTFNSDQAFGTLATRLLRMGLVARRPGGSRSHIHTLTEQGEHLLERGDMLVGGLLEKSFAPLSASERDELGRLLGKLLEAGDLRLT